MGVQDDRSHQNSPNKSTQTKPKPQSSGTVPTEFRRPTQRLMAFEFYPKFSSVTTKPIQRSITQEAVAAIKQFRSPLAWKPVVPPLSRMLMKLISEAHQPMACKVAGDSALVDMDTT